MSYGSRLELEEYRARRLVNVHKHVDGPWFWGRYTAHPYVGCRSGCEFCYCRAGRYLGRREPADFDRVIRVKINAVELLQRELARLTPDVIACGDWQQPAETRYRLSRQMLEIVLEQGFPLFIVERSPLLVRDLDLLVEINRNTWVGVLFSISGLDPDLKRAFEPRSPGVRRRLRAMQDLAAAGIQVGTSMMPILPYIGDEARHLDEMVRATKDHGGICVLGGALTMDGAQAQRTLEAAERFDPSLAARWRALYRWKEGALPRYAPPGSYSARLGLLLREACVRHGLLDRMPRYVAAGPLATNKRLAEWLFLQTYELELQEAPQYRIWAYRKAAWTVDEWPENVASVYKIGGEAGLQALPAIGGSLARRIAEWLAEPQEDEP